MENSYRRRRLSTTSLPTLSRRIQTHSSLEFDTEPDTPMERRLEISSTITRPSNTNTTYSVGFLSVLLVIITYAFQKTINFLKACWNLRATKAISTWIDNLLNLSYLRSLSYGGPFAFPIKAFKDELRIRLERLKIPVNLISTISSEIAAAYHFAFSDDYMEAKRRSEIPERAELQQLIRLQRLEIDRLRCENETLKCELADYEWTITEVINQISPSPSLENEVKEEFIESEEMRRRREYRRSIP